MSIPVGIDLGTTYSAIAFVDGFGKPVCIQNDSGDFVTPSAVYIDERVIRVGKAAEYMENQYPDRVIRFIKQQMGKRDWHFADSVGAEWAPETLSALLLGKLKEIAEVYLEDDVHDAVISVPAYFMDHQRQATIDAGKLAGLNVVSIVNEPTAAALAFVGSTTGMQEIDDGIFLIYDLGGGTFDVTVLQKTPERLRVLGTAGNVELGGANIDYQIMEAMAEAFEDEHGIDPRTEKEGEVLLRKQATELKEALTQVPGASSQIHYEGQTLSFSLDREELRGISSNLLDLTRITVLNLLDELDLGWEDIDRVLLAGGSTYAPMVREMLSEVSGKAPSTSVNADQVVALGTAMWAHSQQAFKGITESRVEIDGDEPSDMPPIQDVAAHSLGTLVESPMGKPLVDVIIPRNSPLPIQNTKTYATVVQKQKAMRIEVFQGEDPEPEFCRVLGEAVFGPLPPYSSGSPIEVTFAYDLNGIIQVTAIDPQTAQRLDFEVRNSSEAPSEFLDLQKQLIESRAFE